MAPTIHVGRKPPKGYRELPGAIHLGRGIWMMRVEPEEANVTEPKFPEGANFSEREMSLLRKNAECPCGENHLAKNPSVAHMVATLVHEHGKAIRVTVGHVTYEVPRAYIAYHGLKADELPALTERGYAKVEKP